MDKVDFVLVGSEAVVESGGLINAVGSNQMAIIAKAAHKPFYALAERYFLLHRLCEQSSDNISSVAISSIDYFRYPNMTCLHTIRAFYRFHLCRPDLP